MIKPLVRWTIGNVASTGWEVFMRSIKIFPKVYPKFDLIICYNNLHHNQLESLKKTGIQLYEQNSLSLGYAVDNSGWKLVPPRLRNDTHELWLDNDVIIFKKSKEIDTWLSSETAIISKGLHGLYGIFKPYVCSDINLCAGVFGLPPHFDFKSKIIKLSRQLNNAPLDKPFDEQGLVASIISNTKNFMCANDIIICETDCKITSAVCGIHFVGANRGNNNAWRHYIKSEKSKIKII